MTPTIFVLVAVAISGSVSSSYYQTERDCLEAKSIAQTGQTIEQIKAADEANAKARSEYKLAHPARQPKDDWERVMVKSGGCSSSSDGPDLCGTPDGLIQELPSSMTISYVHPGDIKYAECFVSLTTPVMVTTPDGLQEWSQKP